MNSIYQRAMGADFERLHPHIQQRFGFSSQDKLAAMGSGVMEEIWHGPLYTLPFLYVGTWRNIMFPQGGCNIPFTIENYAYLDRFGRETITWLRKFNFPQRVRRFDATMIYSQQRRCIVDYLGTHQHLAVDIELAVDPNGGLRLRSGEQRFYEKAVAFRFPMFFSGIAEVCEWYDEASQKFKIEVRVKNKIWGDLFGYRGSFEVSYKPLDPHDIPAGVKPIREEIRE
jgi:hypothetical protein